MVSLTTELPTEKECSVCGQPKPADAFYKRIRVTRTHTGVYLLARCKECIKGRKRAIRAGEIVPLPGPGRPRKRPGGALPLEKFCTRCGTTKSSDDFAKRFHKSHTGAAYLQLMPYCKPCQRTYNQQQHHKRAAEKRLAKELAASIQP